MIFPLKKKDRQYCSLTQISDSFYVGGNVSASMTHESYNKIIVRCNSQNILLAGRRIHVLVSTFQLQFYTGYSLLVLLTILMLRKCSCHYYLFRFYGIIV